MSSLPLTHTTYKVLYCIDELNSVGIAPNNIGVYKVLSGMNDDESKVFSSLKSWSTLISYSQKRITTLINSLIKANLLERRMSMEDGEYYFILSSEGKSALQGFSKKRKVNLKSREKYIKNSFANISKLE